MEKNRREGEGDVVNMIVTIEYVYDGNGNRYSKTVNGQVRYYAYDTSSGNIISEYSKTSDTTNVLVRYVRDVSGKAISMIQGANTYYFVYNGHGDVTALTDSTGTVVATYSYDEFGNDVSNNEARSSNNEIYNPLRYFGAHNSYYDSETGLYKMGTRYYQSDVGRWLTRDDFKGIQESPDTLNKYVYVRNNPLTKVDPTGNWDADYHYSLTYNAARKFGFKYSKTIAEANRDMDSLPNWAAPPPLGKPSYHFDFNGSLKRRYKATFRTALYWKRKNNPKEAAAWLGRGLHSVQDSYSHPKGVFGYINHGGEFIEFLGRKSRLIEFLDWTETSEFKGTYDNPNWNPPRYPNRAEKAKKATERYLIRFNLN